MSVPFYSDESESIHRKISTDKFMPDFSENFSTSYEIERCIKWIKHHNFSKIALQFPDSLLKDAANIASELTIKTEKEIFILGDTSYSSCCVDEIAAAHASADAIIHFGHACLSPTQRLPVLYIFGAIPIDIQEACTAFKKVFSDTEELIILCCDVFYLYSTEKLFQNLKEYKDLLIADLVIPGEDCQVTTNDNEIRVIKCQRSFAIPKTRKLEDYSVFYIGHQSQTLTNLMLSLSRCKFNVYDPVKKIVEDKLLNVNQYIRKRYYYIEKARDANIIGILVGTLGVSNYASVIQHLRDIIRAAGKKSYTLVVGKWNVAKLANFSEIEVFVSVACMESTIVDCTGFYQPIITPYELEIAVKAREWSDEYITDFSELLPGGSKHVPVNVIKPETDVSLITGKTRSIGLSLTEETNVNSSALVQRDEMTISSIHQQAAGEYLSSRSWKGLEQCLGETPAADIVQGNKGIACEYENEGETKE